MPRLVKLMTERYSEYRSRSSQRRAQESGTVKKSPHIIQSHENGSAAHKGTSNSSLAYEHWGRISQSVEDQGNQPGFQSTVDIELAAWHQSDCERGGFTAL